MGIRTTIRMARNVKKKDFVQKEMKIMKGQLVGKISIKKYLDLQILFTPKVNHFLNTYFSNLELNCWRLWSEQKKLDYPIFIDREQ